MQKNLQEQYNNIAKWFDEHRSRELFEQPYLDLAISYMPPNGKVLDLGCGMGEPIAKYFIEKNFIVTGVDVSEKLLALAKARFPQQKFILADMLNLDLAEKFDLIIAWHSFFHLTQQQQRDMFPVFAHHLKQNGILLFTGGPSAGEILSNNGGENLYHASLDSEEYKKLLIDCNFELISYKIEDPECGGATVWLAKYLTDKI